MTRRLYTVWLNVADKKQPIYTDHARDQMADRGITEREVEFCLNNTEITRPGERGYLILTAHYRGKFIKIVVPEDKPTVIVTAGN